MTSRGPCASATSSSPSSSRPAQQVFEEAERLLAELTDAPGSTGSTASAERIEALVASPEPLIRLLAKRFGGTSTAPEPILEVLTRRYYRRRSLEHLRSFRLDGRPCVTGEFDLSGARLHLVSLMAEAADLPAALHALEQLVADVADPGNLVVDLYLSWPDRPADTDALVEQLRTVLARSEPLRRGRRVTATVCTPEGEVEPITFRPAADDGLAEERVIRGLHPLTAQRLNLWRLKNFPACACRRRRTPTCSTSSRRRTRTTSASSRWPRCAT